MPTHRKKKPAPIPEPEEDDIANSFESSLLTIAEGIQESLETDPGVSIETLANNFNLVRQLQADWLDEDDGDYNDANLRSVMTPPAPQRTPQVQRPSVEPREVWQITDTGELGFFVEDVEGDDGFTYKVLQLESGEHVQAPMMAIKRVK